MYKHVKQFAIKNVKPITTFVCLIAIIILAIFFALNFDDKEKILSDKLKDFKLKDIIMIIIGTLGGVIATYVVHLITKNKVADIGTIGVSSLNMFLFTIVYIGANASFYTYRDTFMPIIYFFGSLIMLIGIYLLTYKYKKSANKILLIGIVLSLTIGAVNYAIQASANATRQMVLRDVRAGSLISGLTSLTRPSTIMCYVFLAVSFIALIAFRKQIKIFYVDPIKAKSLGIKVNLIKILLMLIAALCSAVLFTVFGELGFIGFMATNIIYLFLKKVGPLQLILSLLVGVALMTTIYVIQHNLLPSNIPLGIISSIVAVPYLIVILLKGET